MSISDVIGKMQELAANQRCPFCKKPTWEERFRDALSAKEFAISGLCQKCQDDFFDKEEEA